MQLNNCIYYCIYKCIYKFIIVYINGAVALLEGGAMGLSGACKGPLPFRAIPGRGSKTSNSGKQQWLQYLLHPPPSKLCYYPEFLTESHMKFENILCRLFFFLLVLKLWNICLSCTETWDEVRYKLGKWMWQLQPAYTVDNVLCKEIMWCMISYVFSYLTLKKKTKTPMDLAWPNQIYTETSLLLTNRKKSFPFFNGIHLHFCCTLLKSLPCFCFSLI